MIECPAIGSSECNFRPGEECTDILNDQKMGFTKRCEVCPTTEKYWRKKILKVFHNPVCLIDCEIRSGPSCPFTRGGECPMIMTPKKQGVEEKANV